MSLLTHGYINRILTWWLSWQSVILQAWQFMIYLFLNTNCFELHANSAVDSDICTSQQRLPIWIQSLAPGLIPAGVCVCSLLSITLTCPSWHLIHTYMQTLTHTPSYLPQLPHFVLACTSSHLSHHHSVISPSSYLSPLLSAVEFWCWRETCACGVGVLLRFATDSRLSAGTIAWFTPPSVIYTDGIITHQVCGILGISSVRNLHHQHQKSSHYQALKQTGVNKRCR